MPKLELAHNEYEDGSKVDTDTHINTNNIDSDVKG
jgi:hypothetical protein